MDVNMLKAQFLRVYWKNLRHLESVVAEFVQLNDKMLQQMVRRPRDQACDVKAQSVSQ